MTNPIEDPTTEIIKTKATLEDGTKRERMATVALQSVANLATILTGANAELSDLVAECYRLGVNSKIRNFINSGLAASYELITPENVLAMVDEAAASKGQQGAALIAHSTAVRVIIQVAEGAGYSATACGKIKKLVSNPVALSMASQGHKARVIQLLEAVSAAISEETLAEIATPLGKMLAAAQTEEDDDF